MSRRIRVTGRVQGVWYRGWTVGQARALGLSGWVRNRRDGSVEILADGPDEALAELVRRCHEGPPAARVERVEAEESEEAAPAGFVGRRTL
ncbi:MAG: acylphosphatase [Sphingosinicella sp.]|uniref:acylphosphatase n=1 Tax=Sphingosinicella sp. TaxID=1917971 RepID=UPI004037F202